MSIAGRYPNYAPTTLGTTPRTYLEAPPDLAHYANYTIRPKGAKRLKGGIGEGYIIHGKHIDK
jgi:hypothetical protein